MCKKRLLIIVITTIIIILLILLNCKKDNNNSNKNINEFKQYSFYKEKTLSFQNPQLQPDFSD